jgi:hypothetical protein
MERSSGADAGRRTAESKSPSSKKEVAESAIRDVEKKNAAQKWR